MPADTGTAVLRSYHITTAHREVVQEEECSDT